MNSKTHKLLTGFTVVMILVICFAFQFPSVDMTSPKIFYGYAVFFIMCVTLLINLIFTKSVTSNAVFRQFRFPIILIILLLFIHAVWSIITQNSIIFREFIRILPGLGIGLLWLWRGVSARDQRLIHGVLAGSGALVAVGGIVQAVGFDPFQWHYSFAEGVFSTIGHPNMLAPFMVIAGACALALGVSSPTKMQRWCWWSLLPFHLVCLVLTVSKGAWAGVMISGVLMLLIFGSNRTRRFTIAGILILCVAGGAVLVLTGQPMARLVSDNSLRPLIWSRSFYILNSPHRWLVGTGPGTWFVHFSEVRGPDFLPLYRRTENIRHAHNEFLERLTDTGLAGVLITIGIVLIFLRTMVQRHKRRPLCSGELASFFVIVALLIHSVVSVNFRVFSVWTLFWIVLGYGLISQDDVTDETGHKIGAKGISNPTRYLLAQALVVILVISSFGVKLTYGSMHSASLQYQGQVRMNAEDKNPAIDYLIRAVTADQGNLDAKYDLAVTLYETGRFQESEDYFNQILAVAPNFQRIHMNLAILYLQWGRQLEDHSLLDKAYQEIHKELILNDMDENHYMLGMIQRMRGNESASTKAFREFLHRMDRNRQEMETLRGFRLNDQTNLVKPKNWDQLLEMEKAVRGLL